MILEDQLLQVRSGQSAVFEAAMAEAKPLIAASLGFGEIEVRPAISDAADNCLLLVQRDGVEKHRDGFRQSERYAKWCALLHPFYDPMPEVRYFGETL